MRKVHDLSHFSFRIVDHSTVAIEHQGLAPCRVERLPRQPGLAGIACASEIVLQHLAVKVFIAKGTPKWCPA